MRKLKLLAIPLVVLVQVAFAQEPQPLAIEPEQQPVVAEPQPVVQQLGQQDPQQLAQQAQAAGVASEGSGAPINTITVDFGPTLIGLIIGKAGAAAGDEFDISGFGFGVQYEQQLYDQLSVAGKFAYLGIGTGYTTTDVGDEAKANMDISSFSIEAHPRVYPFGGSFFLDGTLGYTNMSLSFDGTVWTEEDQIWGPPIKKKDSYNFEVSRSYLKYGLKLGWRADFGEPGGFIFEHSYGYYWAAGAGKTIGDQVAGEFNEDSPKELDDAIKYLEDFVFVGGPRVTFAFGWKF